MAPLPRPTDAELDILTALWSRGPSTVRDIHEIVSTRKPTQYTTVLKLLQIMTEKGLVRRDGRDADWLRFDGGAAAPAGPLHRGHPGRSNWLRSGVLPRRASARFPPSRVDVAGRCLGCGRHRLLPADHRRLASFQAAPIA